MNCKRLYQIGTLLLALSFLPTMGFSQTRKSASDECGADRRCRIQRIKEINKTRRRNQLQNERRSRRLGAELAETERLKGIPRSRQPFTADLRASLVGILGVGFGYQFADNFRTQFSWQLVDVQNFFDNSIELYGSQFGLSLEYFLTTGALAPFLSGGFHIYDGPAGTNYSSFSSSEREAVLHFAELGAGFDLQLDGYRVRVMGAYKPLIYHQASSGGVHDESSKESLKRTFEEDMQIDVVFQLGYAF